MKMKLSFKKLAILCLGGLLVLACDDHTTDTRNKISNQPFTQLLVYPKKNPINKFELIRHDQKKFDEASFEGRWNLIFMGYTNCPDVCPTMLTDITNIYKKIDPKFQKKFQVIFLSVDPARDDPEHIGKYLDYFHSDFVGITGDKAQIDKLVTSLGGIYSINNEDEEFYSVDHASRIFIVSPKAERYGIVSSEGMLNKDKTQLISELNQLANTFQAIIEYNRFVCVLQKLR